MMAAKKITTKNYPKVMTNLIAFLADQEKEYQRMFCKDFNKFLDNMVAEDAFGTEAQLDPRGDQRD